MHSGVYLDYFISASPVSKSLNVEMWYIFSSLVCAHHASYVSGHNDDSGGLQFSGKFRLNCCDFQRSEKIMKQIAVGAQQLPTERAWTSSRVDMVCKRQINARTLTRAHNFRKITVEIFLSSKFCRQRHPPPVATVSTPKRLTTGCNADSMGCLAQTNSCRQSERKLI